MNKPFAKKVTMSDIAKKTGYSVNTVSHALNNKGDVKETTYNEIMSAVKELGYIGNSLASSLRSGCTNTIAIIIPDISNPYFGIMIKLIETELRKSRYTALVMNTDEDANLEYDAVMAAINKNVDGVIICPCQQTYDPINLMRQNGIPFVLFGRYFKDKNYESVLMDDVTCGYIATRHLLDLGHKDILFLNAPNHISSSVERRSGYETAMKEYNVAIKPSLIKTVTTLNQEVFGYDMRKIVEEEDFTAIFAFSDNIAYETLYFLGKMNLSVPKDYSLISVDNINSHLRYPVNLSSVDSSKDQIAKILINSLFKLINEGFATTVKQLIAPKIIIGGTTEKI